ncbi:DUF302 domain-containing protein [Sulfurimonas aquatica]|uniref:DUF302 domain-containing protein n=1 Tax=Sulfurimonas aquatica TaxID=2672570 RepID=A0A975B1V3_9BACT|nr:DUF302 domain-containing protein [Sulfurimonas aquatica]QSZ42687.1 DUF302 domain-containing protein [Sulfurimonas aquatica]
MKKLVLVLLMLTTVFANEIIIKKSSCSVDTTINNIKNIVTKKGLTVFTVVDHKKNASGVDMNMNESKLIIFGNPKVGTILMNEEMKIGLDLPLKVLVYKDDNGDVKIAYRDATWISKEHQLKEMKVVSKVDNALNKITTKAGQCKKD